MKPIRSLFLLAIGMMVCTVHATTCAPEQKQKTTFQTEQSVLIDVVNVDYPEVVVLTAISNTYVSANYAPSFETETFNLVTFALDDVGWCSFNYRNDTRIKDKYHSVAILNYIEHSKKQTHAQKEIPYKEKLYENYNLLTKNKHLVDFRIRSDC